MDTTIKLDKLHFKTALDNASALGMTLRQYIHALIDADNYSFDQILAPARKGFEDMTDDQIDYLFDSARKAAHQTERAFKQT